MLDGSGTRRGERGQSKRYGSSGEGRLVGGREGGGSGRKLEWRKGGVRESGGRERGEGGDRRIGTPPWYCGGLGATGGGGARALGEWNEEEGALEAVGAGWWRERRRGSRRKGEAGENP